MAPSQRLAHAQFQVNFAKWSALQQGKVYRPPSPKIIEVPHNSTTAPLPHATTFTEQEKIPGNHQIAGKSQLVCEKEAGILIEDQKPWVERGGIQGEHFSHNRNLQARHMRMKRQKQGNTFGAQHRRGERGRSKGKHFGSQRATSHRFGKVAFPQHRKTHWHPPRGIQSAQTSTGHVHMTSKNHVNRQPNLSTAQASSGTACATNNIVHTMKSISPSRYNMVESSTGAAQTSSNPATPSRSPPSDPRLRRAITSKVDPTLSPTTPERKASSASDARSSSLLPTVSGCLGVKEDEMSSLDNLLEFTMPSPASTPTVFQQPTRFGREVVKMLSAYYWQNRFDSKVGESHCEDPPKAVINLKRCICLRGCHMILQRLIHSPLPIGPITRILKTSSPPPPSPTHHCPRLEIETCCKLLLAWTKKCSKNA